MKLLKRKSNEESLSSNITDYEIQNAIGSGSSAIVYLANYIPLKFKVAVKIIELDMFERNQIDELRKETNVMALCRHNNLLRVFGSFVNDDKLYIVTPYLEAGSCLDLLKYAHPNGIEEGYISHILKFALKGLQYLHKNGHIHRDVKAGNLLMNYSGQVFLADFGVSSSLDHNDRKNLRKTFVGTPCWMAPEVMEQAGYNYKADIWSFGITALELASGRAPYSDFPPMKIIMLTLSKDPPTLDREGSHNKYTKSFKDMIETCLQKDPNKRPGADKLLNHSFFKQAKKVTIFTPLFDNLIPLDQRPQKILKPNAYQTTSSWNFSGSEKDNTSADICDHTMDKQIIITSPTSFQIPLSPTAEKLEELEEYFQDSNPIDVGSKSSNQNSISSSMDAKSRQSRFRISGSDNPTVDFVLPAKPNTAICVSPGENIQQRGRFQLSTSPAASLDFPQEITIDKIDILIAQNHQQLDLLTKLRASIIDENPDVELYAKIKEFDIVEGIISLDLRSHIEAQMSTLLDEIRAVKKENDDLKQRLG